MFIRATQQDLPAVARHYKLVSEAMEASGLNQWHWGVYPREEDLAEDIRLGHLWLKKENDIILAAVSVLTKQDPQYLPVNWLYGVRPGLFHRLAILPEKQGQGLGGQVLDEVERMLLAEGCDSLRCDTNSTNSKAIRLYTGRGMRKSGVIRWDDEDPTPYFCFEKPLTDSCPLLPLRMHPAFRDGKLTPWGGDRLKTIYGKEIRQVPTGESLEVSCIPGLESTDDTGVSLPALIEREGAKLVGRYAGQTFPLLLKILDAQDTLSVQVHPDNGYARDHENGKLGKTEAWLILDAPEGSELVYGILPGTDRESLHAACLAGAAVQPLLRRVQVHPGDVCFIPAGCVHAIGAGIVLYEIQQSSDVTYRFYDWDRTDKEGKKRELHIDKALDVTDLSFALDPVPAGDAPVTRVLDQRWFTLDLLLPSSGTVALPAIQDFGMITALEAPMTLTWEGASLTVRKGETVFLPGSVPAVTLSGAGRAALSMPAKGDL